jgi:branched-chain amino acid transport system substrate-binding protein
MKRPCLAMVGVLALIVTLMGCDSEQAQPVKIGFIAVGERPTYLRSAQLAVDEINERGGLFGAPVELVSLVNTEALLPLSVQTAEDMILEDRVIALIGPNRSTHAVEVGPLAQQYGVPMVTTSASNPHVTNAGDFVFMASVTDTFQGRVMAQFASADLGVRTVALLTLSDDVYTEGISEFFAANFSRLGGDVVANVFYDDGTTDFTGQLSGIAALQPDALFISGFIQEIGVITRQARTIPLRNSAGEPTLFLGTDTWDSEILLANEDAELEGSFFTTHFSPDTDEPPARAFIEACQAAYGTVPTGGDAVNYDAVKLLYEAIERADGLDPEAIREQLQATENYAGATRIANYDANRHPAKSSVILTIKNGEKEFHKQIDP